MNIYVILFLVCVLGFAWRWHNQPAHHSPTLGPMEDKHAFAPQSHDARAQSGSSTTSHGALRFSREPFDSGFHTNSVASCSEHTLYSWMGGYFLLDLA